MTLLADKHGIVFGVANKRSIAWAIAQAWHKAGAKLAFTYQGERLKENVEELAGTFGADTLILPCDVTKDDEIASVFKIVGEKFGRLNLMLHSVAFAPKEALEGEFVNTSREAFRVAHDVSAYSLVALSRGRHVLMEKPPCVSLAQLEHLTHLAGVARRTLYQTWHSQHAHGVAPAARCLQTRSVRRLRVTWKEDVLKWHPGQSWIWQAGGFGVLDPGINALSILTRLISEPIFPQAAELFVPSNREAPIAAELRLVSAGGIEIDVSLDFRQTGPQTWDIDIETDQGPLKLSAGGSLLTVGGQEVPPEPGALDSEYASIYRAFAQLIASGRSDVDARPRSG